MQRLIVVPTQRELDYLVARVVEFGLIHERVSIGVQEAWAFPQLSLIVALGGLGKVQFAVQTQYLIDRLEGLSAVLCVGASGALTPEIVHGDVVVATETVEQDIRKFSRPLIPRFHADSFLLSQFADLSKKARGYTLHFGPIASGDEDIVSSSRKSELRAQTNALAVAWEGVGGARACKFSNVPFLELRGITDSASDGAEREFFENLQRVMANLGNLLVDWAGS